MVGPSAPTASRRPAPLFGRGEIHDAVRRALEEVRGGAGQALLLVGEGGVGKSTLLRLAAHEARERGFRVLEGRALPTELPQPFALLQDLLRSDSERARSGPASAVDPASLSGSSLPLFLMPYGGPGAPDASGSDLGRGGWLGLGESSEGTASGESADRLLARLAGPPERVDESRVALFGQITDYFAQLAKRAPLLLAVDDLQFADAASVEFFRHLALEIGSHRIAVLATIAPDIDASSRAPELLRQFVNEGRAHRLTVRRMTEPEVGEYVRWLLQGRDPGRDAVMRWFTQTEGNPLFLEHLVRAGGKGEDAKEAERPQDLDEALRARVQNLNEDDRRALVYAAVLGKEFDFRALATASGEEEEKLAEAIDRLVRDGVLREKGDEVYEFVSERFRAEAYGPLTETRRRILHRKVATALEARGTPDTARTFELARQFYLGRDDAKAFEYNRRAAELALRAYAYDTAIVHLDRTLESLRRIPQPDHVTEFSILVELGRVLDENGDLRRSEDVLLDAVARARSAPPGREAELALALLWLARARCDLGKFTSARELATEAFTILTRLGHRRGLMVAHKVLGTATWRVGDFAEGERHQRAQVALAQTEGDDWERGHALVDLANTIIQSPDRLSEALGLYGAAAELFDQHKDYSAQARVHMNRALLYHNAGDVPRSHDDLRHALEAAERSHSRIWIGYCLLNEALFAAEEGRVEAAQRAIGRTAELLEPLGDQLAIQQIRMIRGMALESEGKYEEAEAAYAEALRLARTLGLGGETAEMLFRQARLRLRRGRREEAERVYGEALAAGLKKLRGDLYREVEEFERTLVPSDPASASAASSPRATPAVS